MVEINSDDFLKELRFDLQTHDMIKAKIVLSHINEVDDKTKKAALFELSRADDQFAIPLITSVIAKNSAIDDAFPLLKETLFSKALDNPNILMAQLIKESDRDQRIILINVAGEIGSNAAIVPLIGILNEVSDEKILKAAISSLGLIGDLNTVTSISEFLYSGNVELIIAAIHALGNIATPTAIQRLWEKLGADIDLDLIIFKVLGQSQIPEALEKLNEALASHHAHIRNAAKSNLKKIGNKAVPVLVKNLLYDDPDLLIHTLNLLGDIGDESSIMGIRKLLHNEPKDPNVRFAAYEALGRLPVKKGMLALTEGLQDTVENVRSAAASAIDHNYNSVLAAGVKNMIRERDEGVTDVIETIIDAQCIRIFMDLINEDFFYEGALEYLSRRAHPDIRSYYLNQLVDQGREWIAEDIERREKDRLEIKKSLKVCAVDDSKMILNIYRSVLHSLGCESKLFEFPAVAIEYISNNKPDVVLTDLNMPEINGIELIREIRHKFAKEDLPIIMVTTQNASQDNDAAFSAGVNDIIQKPFDEEEIRRIFMKHGIL